MEKTRIIRQVIEKSYPTPLVVATMYYTLLFSLNGIHLTPMDIHILAYTAIRGNIACKTCRQGFIEIYNSSDNSIANTVSKLFKKGLLIKRDDKTIILPSLFLDFSSPLVLNIALTQKKTDGKQ